MCGDEYINYYVGEKRELEGTVFPKTQGETVVITSAEYTITKEISGELVSSGVCRIDGNRFEAMLSFDEAGEYVFTVKLKIGEEEPIEKAYIRVKG